ncbi:hypothetical protein V498_08171, partial [Pseudogymnoascus sp. VKM F-4517 (FW-2822)]
MWAIRPVKAEAVSCLAGVLGAVDGISFVSSTSCVSTGDDVSDRSALAVAFSLESICDAFPLLIVLAFGCSGEGLGNCENCEGFGDELDDSDPLDEVEVGDDGRQRFLGDLRDSNNRWIWGSPTATRASLDQEATGERNLDCTADKSIHPVLCCFCDALTSTESFLGKEADGDRLGFAGDGLAGDFVALAFSGC